MGILHESGFHIHLDWNHWSTNGFGISTRPSIQLGSKRPQHQWHHRPSVSHKSLNLCDSIGVWKDVDPISGGPVEGQGQSGVNDQLQEIRIPTGWICGRWGFPCRSRRQRADGMTRPGSWRLPQSHRRKTSKPSTDKKKLQLAPLRST